MEKRKTKRLLSLILATVMSILLIGSSVFADGTTGTTYSAIDGPTDVKFKKVLILPADTPVPTAGFTFSIDSGTAIPEDTTNGTYGVKAGIISGEYPKAANDAIFTSGDNKDGSASDATYGEYTTSCTKEVSIDFGTVKFPEPGVYRYVITETAAVKNTSTGEKYANTAIKNDSKSILMDVYVKDDGSGNLVIWGTTMYKAAASDQETIKPKTDGSYPADTDKSKTDKFVNEYPTNTVKLKKVVTGNQGSKDEWFKFTVTITAPTGTDLSSKIAVSGQTPEPSANAATSYTEAAMKTQNEKSELALSEFASSENSSGYDLYLQHSNEVLLQGIPENCVVSITEANPNKYTISTSVKETGGSAVTGDNASVSATVGTKDIDITYTNNKNGEIPTGVIVSVAGLLVVGVIAIIGFVFFGTRSRRRYEED